MGAAPRHSNGGGGSKHSSMSSSRRINASPFNKKALASAAAKDQRKIPTAKRIRDLTRLLSKVRGIWIEKLGEKARFERT